MDLTESIAPRSDQLNADDLMSGPRTVTIADVNAGTPEQPVNVVLAEFGPGRPYKPSKSMRRIMVAAWGPEASTYAGHRLTIFRNPSIRFGKDEVGGIQISALSHIDKPLTVALTVTRGKRSPFTVQPLPAAVQDESARLFDLFKQHKLDKAAALELCTQETGRQITATKDLSPAEIATVIAALTGGDSA